jgi:hypothetical protein
MTKNSKSDWPRLKKALNTLDKPALIQLIGQLATLSETNGRFPTHLIREQRIREKTNCWPPLIRSFPIRCSHHR